MQLLDFFCKTCAVPEFAFCLAFSSSFCNVLNFGALTGGPPKVQKMHNSRICMFFAFFTCFSHVFLHVPRVFFIVFSFFSIFEDRGPSQKCTCAHFQMASRICMFFAFLFFFSIAFLLALFFLHFFKFLIS